jgi:hypothetical protein
MECGESVELPEQTASGSPEGGPHPQVECADWAVCPKELQPCYDSYPEGNECISGRMNVRFAHIPFGGDGECEDAQPGPDEPKECVLYHDSIANPTWCCNGYVANKTTWIHDSKHIYNCCVAGLESLYPDIDVADHIDPDGTFNYGLELKGDHEESSAFHLVCMEWFTADGTSWPDFILSASPITAQTYNIDHAVGDGAAKSLRVFCDPDQDPLWPEPQVLSTLGLGPGVSWVAPGGESCDDIQESSY